VVSGIITLPCTMFAIEVELKSAALMVIEQSGKQLSGVELRIAHEVDRPSCRLVQSTACCDHAVIFDGFKAILQLRIVTPSGAARLECARIIYAQW